MSISYGSQVYAMKRGCQIDGSAPIAVPLSVESTDAGVEVHDPASGVAYLLHHRQARDLARRILAAADDVDSSEKQRPPRRCL